MYIVKRIHALKDAREERNLELVVVSIETGNFGLSEKSMSVDSSTTRANPGEVP